MNYRKRITTEMTMQGLRDEQLKLLSFLWNHDMTGFSDKWAWETDGFYFKNVWINGKKLSISVVEFGSLIDYVNELSRTHKKIYLDFEGPYSEDRSFQEATMYQKLGALITDSYFEAESYRYEKHLDRVLRAVLKDCTLSFEDYQIDHYDVEKRFEEILKSKISYDEFCSLFRVKPSDFLKKNFAFMLGSEFFQKSYISADYDGFMTRFTNPPLIYREKLKSALKLLKKYAHYAEEYELLNNRLMDYADFCSSYDINRDDCLEIHYRWYLAEHKSYEIYGSGYSPYLYLKSRFGAPNLTKEEYYQALEKLMKLDIPSLPKIRKSVSSTELQIYDPKTGRFNRRKI